MGDRATAAPIQAFVSYAHEDEDLRRILDRHLAGLRRQGLVAVWHDREILPGSDFGETIDEHLETAQLVLLLVSASFLDSDYCYEREMKRALERHAAGEGRVVPVILRPCDWTHSPIGHLLALPTDAKAITSWPNQDEAFTDVARGIRRIIMELTAAPKPAALASPAPAIPTSAVATQPTGSPPPSSFRATASLAMLGSDLVHTERVNQAPDGSWSIVVPAITEADDAVIQGLGRDSWDRDQPIAFAYRNDGFQAHVRSREATSEGDVRRWTLSLVPEKQREDLLETGYAGSEGQYSADQIAELRARRMLLNDPPPDHGRHPAFGFESILRWRGHNHCILHELYPKLRHDPQRFLATARLAAVHQLKTTGIVEHIEALELGPITGSIVPVRFAGTRRRVYTNEPPPRIEFEGECVLPGE